jgi:hypothetical protein
MQVICNYVPETDNVFRIYKVADILWLQFMENVIIFPILLLLLLLLLLI